MKPEHEDLCAMCDAASSDERMADGMLYRKAADAIRELSAENESLAAQLAEAQKVLSDWLDGRRPDAQDEEIAAIVLCPTILERMQRAEAALAAREAEIAELRAGRKP